MRARVDLHTGQDGTACRLCAESTTISKQNRQKSCPHRDTTGSTIRSVCEEQRSRRQAGSDRVFVGLRLRRRRRALLLVGAHD